MGFHGDHRNAELIRDHLVPPPGEDLRHDLPLAQRQGFVTTEEHSHRSPVNQRGTATVDGGAHCIQQQLFVQRHGQELDSPRFHRVHHHPKGRKRRRENHGQLGSIRAQRLHIEPAHVREIYIQHQAGGVAALRVTKEGVGVCKDFGLPSTGADHGRQRFARDDVGIDDEYDRHDSTSRSPVRRAGFRQVRSHAWHVNRDTSRAPRG